MDKMPFKFLSLMLVAALCACTTHKLVDDPYAKEDNEIVAHCNSEGETWPPYLNTMPATAVRLVVPPEAKAHKISGCGAVKFQIGSDGRAKNVTILRENPPHSGYGEAIADTIRNSTYRPSDASDGWYLVHGFVNLDRPPDVMPYQIR